MVQYIGVDIHRKFMQVCVMDAQGQVGKTGRLEMDEPLSIERFFGQFPDDTQVAVEATCGWMWLADLLEAQGLQVHPAPKAMRDMRLILRHRQGLVAWRTSAKNKVHGLR